jgi:hypothetical protein
MKPVFLLLLAVQIQFAAVYIRQQSKSVNNLIDSDIPGHLLIFWHMIALK